MSKYTPRTLWWNYLVRLAKAGKTIKIVSPTKERSKAILRELKQRLEPKP